MTTTASEPDAPPSPEAIALRDIQKKQTEIDVAANRVSYLKEELKEAKDHWEGLVIDLGRLIKGTTRTYPLFDPPKANGHATEPPFPAPREDWRNAPLSELGLSEVLLRKLEEADLHTVGDLQRFVEQEGKNGFSDPITKIKGIGAANAEKIAAALDEFWKRRGMDAPAPTTDPTPPPSDPGPEGAAAVPPISALPVRVSIMDLDLPHQFGERATKALAAAGLTFVDQLETMQENTGLSLESALRQGVKGVGDAMARAIADAVARLRATGATRPQAGPETRASDEEE